VEFVVTVKRHNPTGAEPFKGKINQEIEVTLAAPGVYGAKYSPHYDMVMLIQVGKGHLIHLRPFAT
jgi:plastocyanin